ncbi:MAG: adenosine deaminase family protein, partial [Deltaproteobacteria bacterium]|nr:adenosine deaminase family protein [Deltaproteobacteria bacterium]
MNLSRDFLQAIPKTDVHVHLDGSLRLSTLINLAKQRKVNLPSFTEEGLKELVFKDKYRDLPDYLQGFMYTVAVMQDPEAIERIAYELAEDCFNENVCYLEIRFAPQQHVHDTFTMDEVLKSADRGLKRAKKDLNNRPEVKCGEKPRFEYGIIACALRMFRPEFSAYYKQLSELHPFLPETERYAMASVDLARAIVHTRETSDVAVVGFDLAGAEKGYPAGDHRQAYDLAHRHFIMKTVHAGEAYGPASIFQAITDCHADRIGHGT